MLDILSVSGDFQIVFVCLVIYLISLNVKQFK